MGKEIDFNKERQKWFLHKYFEYEHQLKVEDNKRKDKPLLDLLNAGRIDEAIEMIKERKKDE